MSLKSLFLIILLAGIIALGGCSSEKKDCSNYGDQYHIYSYNKDTGKCELIRVIKKGCGNGIIEEDENACNCPEDVNLNDPEHGCSGTKGDYLNKECKNKKCVLVPNDNVVETTKTLNIKDSYLNFIVEITADKPYITNSFKDSIMKIKINLFDTKEGISDVKIEAIRVIDSYSNLLGSSETPITIKESESITKTLKLNPYSDFYKKTKVRVELYVSYKLHKYDSQGNEIYVSDQKSILKGDLGYWDFINAKIDQEEKK